VIIFFLAANLLYPDHADIIVSFLPEISETTNLIPYTKSAIPNKGETGMIIHKATAKGPAATLNALEPLPTAFFLPFFSWLLVFAPLKPAIILAIPPSNKSKATSKTTNAAEARGYAKIMLDRNYDQYSKANVSKSGSRALVEKYSCNYLLNAKQNRIIATAVKVVTTVRIEKMIAA
jgi:hypothetical protein